MSVSRGLLLTARSALTYLAPSASGSAAGKLRESSETPITTTTITTSVAPTPVAVDKWLNPADRALPPIGYSADATSMLGKLVRMWPEHTEDWE